MSNLTIPAVKKRYEAGVSLDALRPHPANARQGDVGAIYESIQAHGFYNAILAQEGTGVIIAGEHRWKALREVGQESTCDVLWLDVDDEEALRILLVDNKTSDAADWNKQILKDALDMLMDRTDAQLTGTGFDVEELEKIGKDLARPLNLDEPRQRENNAGRPTYELVFDGSEQLADWNAMLLRLKAAYPHHDSVEQRLLECLNSNLMEAQ